MDMAFKGLIKKVVLVYLDDITVFSKNAADHLFHLRQVFQRCRRFGVSLNPKKCVFLAHKGKLLGHIVYREGLTIDPERVEAIQTLPLPHHKKSLQRFLGRINFVRRFVPNFATLVKLLTMMLKKSLAFKWTAEGKESFENIKHAISQAPTLINPDFSKDFMLYAFGGLDTISAILTQLNREGSEHPIAFFNQTLEDYEIKYSFIEKHVLAVIRSLKKFRNLVSNNKIELLVSYAGIKDFLLNKDLNEKRVGWITRVMEYDIEIKVTKLFRGKGLCEQLASKQLDESKSEEDVILLLQHDQEQPADDAPIPCWPQDLVHYLQTGLCPPEVSKAKRRYF
ncbi:hypothetical protein KI387_043801 [Taxus chinensis]|uniref:Reverse transcriptase domain-containing protein n=1 Tax=Taxus chinensis TaxID=29808 RepID=A0AA38KMM8_TAXCH|nr:hypothetical protein KI387_043801 [Taxus chinensis]